MSWKSKTLAVDYFMVDERMKAEPNLMDYMRSMLFETYMIIGQRTIKDISSWICVSG